MVLDNTCRHEGPGAILASKQPRSEASSSESTASTAGKGVAKIMADWAGPKIAEAAIKLHNRAAQLRRSIQSSKEATAKLQELSGQEKTPRSFMLKLTPAAQKLLSNLPGAAEHIRQAEKSFLAEAMRQRQADEMREQAELTTITSGDQFELVAKAATRFDSLSSEEQALVEPLILNSKEEFLTIMHLSQLDMSAKDERKKDAQAKRPANKERRENG